MKHDNHDTLDQRIAAAKPDGHTSHFTDQVMAQVASAATFDRLIRTKSTNRNPFMRYITKHRLIAAVVGLITAGLLSFSGYAYATGTDPVSLVRRIVVGKHVDVDYEGHKFTYGANRTYSDAAVTAYAELNTVRVLYFHASNAFMKPHDGYEYFGATDTSYQYPWVGTIERVDATQVYIQRQYTIGDKMTASTNDSKLVTIPRSQLSYFIKGDAAQLAADPAGKVVQIFSDPYLQYRTGSKVPPARIRHYFAFELTHTLANITEADQDKGHANSDPAQQGLTESDFGALSNVCMNNAADTCDTSHLSGGDVHGLYEHFETVTVRGVTRQFIAGQNNPDCIPFGEALRDPSQQAPDLLLRNVEGKVTHIDGDTVSIKTSSGAIWTLHFPAGLVAQKAAGASGSPLKLGDRLGGSIIASTTNLENRDIANSHIYNFKRY